MDLLAEDPGLITEEQFDFTFGSPASDSLEQSSQEVEEEVFVGPVSHVERCVTRSLDLNTKEEVSRSTPGPPRWSPLTTEKFEEVCREANRIARQLEKATVKENLGKSPLVATLINGREPCRSPRRETYVVKDSPVRLLLPDISLDGVTNGDGGLASPSLHISSNAATPTTDRSTPTKQKATSKVCKTTPAVHKATHAATEPKLSVTESSPTARKGRSILDKTTPTAIKDTVFTGKVTPTTGKTAPGTKKATPTAGTPRRGTPSTATRNQVTPMRGSAKPNRSHSTKQAAGQAMPVSALHSQSMKSGLGIGGQSSIESSAGLQHEHGSHDGTGTGMQPFLIYGSPGDKRDFKVTQKADCSLSHRVAPTSQVSSMRGPAVCAKTKSKPLARSISATQASHTASTHLPKPSKGLRHQTTCTAIPRPVSQSAPQGKLMASGTGMSRLPVYRSLPVAQLCSSQSVSQGSKGVSHCHSISQGDGIRHKKGAQMVFQ